MHELAHPLARDLWRAKRHVYVSLMKHVCQNLTVGLPHVEAHHRIVTRKISNGLGKGVKA